MTKNKAYTEHANPHLITKTNAERGVLVPLLRFVFLLRFKLSMEKRSKSYFLDTSADKVKENVYPPTVERRDSTTACGLIVTFVDC